MWVAMCMSRLLLGTCCELSWGERHEACALSLVNLAFGSLIRVARMVKNPLLGDGIRDYFRIKFPLDGLSRFPLG